MAPGPASRAPASPWTMAAGARTSGAAVPERLTPAERTRATVTSARRQAEGSTRFWFGALIAIVALLLLIVGAFALGVLGGGTPGATPTPPGIAAATPTPTPTQPGTTATPSASPSPSPSSTGAGVATPSPSPTPDPCVIEPGQCTSETPSPSPSPTPDPCLIDPGQCTSGTPSPSPSPTPDPCATNPDACQPPVDACLTDPGTCTDATIERVESALGMDTQTIAQVNDTAVVDKAHDGYGGGGETPTIDPDQFDILRMVNFETYLGQPIATGLGPCGPGVVCASKTAGAPGQYHVTVLQYRGAIVPANGAFHELGMVLWDPTPLDGKKTARIAFGPGSFLTGSNVAYSIRIAGVADGGQITLLRLAHDKDESFLHGEPTDAFIAIRGPVVALFVPAAEWSGVVSGRAYSFYSQAQPSAATNDASPDIGKKMVGYPENKESYVPLGVSALPDGLVFFAPYTTTDQTIDHCEHIYGVTFTVTDSNNQSAPYEGHVVTYQLLDNQKAPFTTFVGPGGKVTDSIDETFEKSPSGSTCRSHFQPHILTLDGVKVFG